MQWTWSWSIGGNDQPEGASILALNIRQAFLVNSITSQEEHKQVLQASKAHND